MLRIAHLSDPHFASITYHPGQFFSKRWLGNTNLMFFRQKRYQTEHLGHLAKLLADYSLDAAVITGDFTTTSLDAEFEMAKSFVDSFGAYGIKTFLLPGNHDIYTRGSQKKGRFYQYFPNPELQQTRVELKELPHQWWYIGLDCALATGLLFSNGKFFKKMQETLENAIAKVPSEGRIIIANHFPLFSALHWRHGLIGAKRLQAILKRHPKIKLYLHGHDHIPYIIDNPTLELPLMINSGSVAHLPRGSFYLLELSKLSCLVKHLTLKKESQAAAFWTIDQEKSYTLR